MNHTLHTANTKGGSQILFVNTPGSSSYYINTICNAGYNYAPKRKYELPHLLEHLAFEGSTNFPDASDLSYELERLGGWSNAFTYEQYVRYIMVGSIKDFHQITKLALEQYTQPLFKVKNITEQKKVLEREFKRQVDSDDSKVRALTYTRLFPDKLSFPNDRIATLKNIKRPDILDYYKSTHTQANTIFVIAGDLDAQHRKKITKQIESAMKVLPQGKKLFRLNKLYTGGIQTTKALTTQLRNQAHFSIAFINPRYDNNIQYQAACRVAMAIYNQGDYSRIFRKSREAGLAYGVNSGISTELDYSELYIIDKTDPHLVPGLVELCLTELVDITLGNFTHEELERAKGYTAGDCDTEYETSRELADWYGPVFAADEPLFSPQEFADAIRNVQKSDVVKALRKFVKKDSWIASIVAHDASQLVKQTETIISKSLAKLQDGAFINTDT